MDGIASKDPYKSLTKVIGTMLVDVKTFINTLAEYRRFRRFPGRHAYSECRFYSR